MSIDTQQEELVTQLVTLTENIARLKRIKCDLSEMDPSEMSYESFSLLESKDHIQAAIDELTNYRNTKSEEYRKILVK